MINESGDVYSNYKKGYMSPSKDKDDYLRLALSSNEKGKRVYVKVHTLVAYNYIGEPPKNIKDPTINHIDENKLNNNYENLEWIERGVNSSIRSNKGQGDLNHEAKLNWELVSEIREKYSERYGSYQKIADEYNVSKSTIALIIQNKTWRLKDE